MIYPELSTQFALPNNLLSLSSCNELAGTKETTVYLSTYCSGVAAGGVVFYYWAGWRVLPAALLLDV